MELRETIIFNQVLDYKEECYSTQIFWSRYFNKNFGVITMFPCYDTTILVSVGWT
jgi:hypothetical protein